jgi:hypothetical protein
MCDGPVSEVWQALRWRDFDRHLLNPMWTADGLKQFYVDELAEVHDGTFVIPQMWVTFHGEVWAECTRVSRTLVSKRTLNYEQYIDSVL